MGLIKTLAVVGGGAYALNELSKQQNSNRSANVAVKSTIDPLAVKEAIAKDPNLLALVRGETGPQGPQGVQGLAGIGVPTNHILGSNLRDFEQSTNGINVVDRVKFLNGKQFFIQYTHNGSDYSVYSSDGLGGIVQIMNVSASGVISKIGGGSFSAISDQRLKDNIEDFQKGLESVLSIETKTFNYKKVAGTQTEFYPDSICNKTQYGVVAQQLKEVCPEMVTQDEQGFYSVDLSNLPLMLVNAVKELSSKLDTVTNNYEALLQRVEALENPPATA